MKLVPMKIYRTDFWGFIAYISQPLLEWSSRNKFQLKDIWLLKI